MRLNSRQSTADVQEWSRTGEEAGRHAVKRPEVSAAGGSPAPGRGIKVMTQSVAEQLEGRLGYRFKKPELLERALTHSSAVPELRAGHNEESAESAAIQDNERLEFLGDAVLELLAREY